MANQIKLTFGDSTEGKLEAGNKEINVSYTGKAMAPYELFLGGFAACLHATFMGIMRKRKLEYTEVTYDVTGEKRDVSPTILTKVVTNVVIYGTDPEKKKAIMKSMEQAEKYCSISHTIQNLDAEMEFNIEFK